MKSNVHEKMQMLFIAYTKNLPLKIEALEEEWQRLQKNWDSAGIQTFHRNVHSLAGSAGTYGYTSVGKAAREFEIFLKTLLTATAITQTQEDNISEYIEKLKTTLAIASPEKTTHFPEANLTPEMKIIYIYESDVILIKDLKVSLNETGYTVIAVKNISELHTHLKELRPATLIVDINELSEENNKQLIQLHEENPSLPIVCISKEGDLLTRLHAVRLGSSAFFQKPIDIYYIAKMIDQLCGFSPTEPYRILIVDDSNSLGEYYSLILREAGMQSKAITNPLELMTAIDDFQPDLLLMDIYMPECTGLELADVLRQETTYTRLPIIFLSTEDDKFKQLSAMSLGGDDFLTKPILPQHLVEAVKSRAKRAGILNSYMITDSLTGLLNHTNILERLDIELSRAARHQTPLCFVMVDIDHFKSINDSYGHPVGDKVIRKLASLLVTRLRKIDLVGRYGGEEFAVILPNTSSEDAIQICNFVREQFAECLFEGGQKQFSVTISLGIASFPQIKDSAELVAASDQALYEAKHNGRNRVEYFSVFTEKSS